MASPEKKPSEMSPSGIPRYFKPTHSSSKFVEEKAKLRAEIEAEKIASASLISRPTTPGRRMSTGSEIPRPITPGRKSIGNESKSAASSLNGTISSSPIPVQNKDPRSSSGSLAAINVESSAVGSTSPKLGISALSINSSSPVNTSETVFSSACTPTSGSKRYSNATKSSTSRAVTPGREVSEAKEKAASPVIPSEVVNRLLKPTQARMLHIKELEESKGQIKPEDDPWWDKRGGRVIEAAKLKDAVKKKLSHVTSKLHAPTESRIHQSRDKAVIEKPGPAPVPKLSSPDAINPHKNVPSRLHRPTAAAINGEWRPKETKKSPNLSKKAPEVNPRLLMAPVHTVTTKYVKEHDPYDVGNGWVKILPAGSGTQALVKPFEAILPLPGENLTDKYLNYEYDEEGIEAETEYAVDGAAGRTGRAATRDRSSGGSRSRSRPRSSSRRRPANLEDLVFQADAELPPPNSNRASVDGPPAPPS